MKCAVYFYCVTPHQLPFVEELIPLLGSKDCAFIYQNRLDVVRVSLGWDAEVANRFINIREEPEYATRLIYEAEVLITEVRDADIFESRGRKGLRTFYTSERWFKKPMGMVRMFHPGFFRMAMRVARCMIKDPNFYYLPVGVYAAQDMARLCALSQGVFKALLWYPPIDFEHKAGGRVFGMEADARYCLDKLRMWSYFVSAGRPPRRPRRLDPKCSVVRVLWAGRMLRLKRVDTLIAAIRHLVESEGYFFVLDLVGTGPDEPRLKKLASGCDYITFTSSVKAEVVRELMRTHDVYVFTSNAQEGWGAVINEALEESMWVYGTEDSGAGATLLPMENQFRSGDWRTLCERLRSLRKQCAIGKWSASAAAQWLADLINGDGHGL